jgi:hypothetical protein
MALVLNYTTASSNLPAFLESWTDSFQYRGNGFFNSVLANSDQWIAGTPIPTGGSNNDKSSVIVNGNDFSYTPGVVDGDVDTLELGSNLRYVQGSDSWTQDAGLLVDFSGATLTPPSPRRLRTCPRMAAWTASMPILPSRAHSSSEPPVMMSC